MHSLSCKTLLSVAGVLALLRVVGVAGEVSSAPVIDYDPFPAFSDLSKAELYPRDAAVRVAPEGHLEVGGVPRYLTATIYYEGCESETQTTIGYKPELAWVYEHMPDYEDSQRLGIDGVGLTPTLDWMGKYREGFKGHGYNKKETARFTGSGLPVYVDYTASEWSHGSMFPGHSKVEWTAEQMLNPLKPGKRGIPVEAWTHGKHHWVPYSMVHPDGRNIWKTMWAEGAKSVLERCATPFCYELLNEPSYWEDNEMTRAVFDRKMAAEGKTALVAENTVANHVEFQKFMEASFASLMREGRKAIATVDPRPEALVCFQPCTFRTLGLDLYAANKPLNAICSHTGGRGIAECHALLGLADGKPVLDSEMYVGITSNSIRNAYLTQYMRGFNISYLFKWSRRPNEMLKYKRGPQDANGRDTWVPDLEESLKAAQRMSAYNVRNPYKVAPDQLLGIRMAKQDILDVNEFFTPRDRGVPVNIALLYSTPTDRLGQAAGRNNYRFYDAAAQGMEMAHVSFRVLWEEDVPAKLARSKMLVAAGTDATYRDTAKAVEKFVRAGGTLVLYGQAMQFDEYGRRNGAFPGIAPSETQVVSETERVTVYGRELDMSAYTDATEGAEGWRVMARVAGRDAIFEKAFGAGRVVYINAKMSGDSVGALVSAIAQQAWGEQPLCSVRGLDNEVEQDGFEVRKAVRHGMEAYLIQSHTMGQGAVRFSRAAADTATRATREGDVCYRLRNHAGVATRTELEIGPDGTVPLEIRGDIEILVFGSREALTKRYGAPTSRISFAEGVEKGRAFRKELEAKRVASRDFFAVDPSRVKPLDLRAFANSRFVDQVALDGKGGWTDQGVGQSLDGTPWGVVSCNGVPMEFIRYDQNNYLDCIVLSAPERIQNRPDSVKGIPVEQKAGALYFLHAVAWGAWNQKAFEYVVHYADGTDETLPVIAAQHVWDWGFIATVDEMTQRNCVRGWSNEANRGLYLWRWDNPHPEKTIASLDIVSAKGTQIPLIAAISVEAPSAPVFTADLTSPKARAFSGKKGITASLKDGVASFVLDETAEGFSGGNLEFPGISCEGRTFRRIVFDVNKAPDKWGKYHENPTPQLALLCRDANNKWFFTQFHVPNWLSNDQKAYRADDDPETWQTAYIPISNFQIEERAKLIYGIMLQYQLPWFPGGTDRSGLSFRNIRFETEE